MKTILETIKSDWGYDAYINEKTLYAAIGLKKFAKMTIEESNLHIVVVSTKCGVLDKLIIPLSNKENAVKKVIEYLEFFDNFD